jgi:hypothetical protein
MKKILAAVLLILTGAASAQAGVNFSVNLGVPLPVTAYPAPAYPAPVASRVVVEEAPRFIYATNLGCYVSVGTPYDMVYGDNGYYRYSGGTWYLAPSYRGPWRVVAHRELPYGLGRHSYQQVRYYRDLEYRRYQHDRDHYRGAWHQPVSLQRDERGSRDRWDPERRDGRWDGHR